MAPLVIVFAAMFIQACASSEPDLVFQTEEEMAPGSLVGRISAASVLQELNADVLNSLSYTLLSNSEPKLSGFVLVEVTSGNMYVDRTIDREAVCGSVLKCEFDLSVAVNSASNSYINVLIVRLEVIDKNDNSPMFSVTEYNLNISEGAPVGSPFSLITAIDEDIGNNSIQSYILVPSSLLFTLNVTKTATKTFSVKLILSQQLDREKQQRHSVQLQARDGGDPYRFDSVTVYINVLDENDNAPKFLQPSYNIDLKENSPQNTLITQVLASDIDIGDNSKVFYRLSQQQPYMENVQDFFTIDKDMGYIRLAKDITGLKPNTNFSFYVEASDSGVEPQVSQVLVSVRIADAGNNAPILTPSILVEHTGSDCRVPESIPVGTPLMHVQVEDTDSGSDGDVTCTLNSTDFTLQTVSGTNYFIKVAKPLDYEQTVNYRLVLFCEDKATLPLSSNLIFNVNVLDVNDNIPVFVAPVISTNITENIPMGVTLCQVSATDADSGENKLVHYYLEDNAVSMLSINPATGVVTTRVAFDREITSSLTFRVLAVDSGIPARTGTATVYLKILDQNDNTPNFSPGDYNIFTPENGAVNMEIGVILAHDPDEGVNGKVTYDVVGQLPERFPFVIHSNGTVISTTSLDREFQSKYEFNVRAMDGGKSPKQSTTKVVINVVDQNDNRPLFVFPNDNNDTVHISHLLSIPSKIVTISAYDRDLGENRDILYSIEQGNDLELFSINQNTGSIFLQSSYNIDKDTLFSLLVCAQDRGVPPLEICHVLHVMMKMDNITSDLSSRDHQLTVILAVVVVFTVVVSSVIIMVIFLLRRKDMQKKREAIAFKKEQEAKQNTQYFTSACPSDSLEKVATLTHVDMNRKKKKEVSFSLDEDNSLLEIPNGSINNFKETKQHNPNALQLHQFLIYPQNQKQSKHTDDVSDASGESTPSDSGRGGSDTDGPISYKDPYCGHGTDVSNMSFSSCMSPPHLPPKRSLDPNRSYNSLNRFKNNLANIYSISANSGSLNNFQKNHDNDSHRIHNPLSIAHHGLNKQNKDAGCSPSYV